MTIDETEVALISYINASKQAQLVLSQLRGIKITPFEIQNALCAVLNIEHAHPNRLLEEYLTEERIVSMLRGFNFRQYRTKILAEIEFEEGVIPADIFRLLTEKIVKVKGEVWYVYKKDVDPFPSVPHAHNYDLNP